LNPQLKINVYIFCTLRAEKEEEEETEEEEDDVALSMEGENGY